MATRRGFLRALVGTITATAFPISIPKTKPKPTVQELNATLFERLGGINPDQATIDAVNNFTRMKVRESGFYRKILQEVKDESFEYSAPAA